MGPAPEPSHPDAMVPAPAEVPVVGTSFGLVARRREQILFLVVGAWNTVFGYGVWAILQATLGDVLPYLVIVVVAWPIAVLNAFFMHRTFVFRSKEPIPTELRRIFTISVVALSYLAHKYYSFGRRRTGDVDHGSP
jgi:putative flippase GtrA